ncbi:hypothetical protein GCM10010455_10590 [Microbacterium esteraromaticum]
MAEVVWSAERLSVMVLLRQAEPDGGSGVPATLSLGDGAMTGLDTTPSGSSSPYHPSAGRVTLGTDDEEPA